MNLLGRQPGSRRIDMLKGLLQYLKDEWKAKKGGEMDVSEWKLVPCTKDTPQQLNGESVCCPQQLNCESVCCLLCVILKTSINLTCACVLPLLKPT